MVDVKIQNLTQTFGSGSSEIVAVDDISLTIEDGEFVTLVGPSGCGKTTTLRCVAGLETASSGSIVFDDRDVTELSVQQRNIALLFQDIALYPHMNVRDNIAYGLKIAGVSKEERYQRVAEAAEILQIGDQLDKSPAELSGGQQQRVALGRSLVRDPSVFLFDEPMSDLDAKLKRDLRPMIQQITQRIGCPVLYVTHDQEEAMTMSDRIAVMNGGRLEQVGPPKEVYTDPATEFVSGFIGQPTTQFFDGRVFADNGTAHLQIENHEFALSCSSEDLDGYVGEWVRVGVRPQNIHVNEIIDGGIPAEHVLDEPLGDETHSFFETEFGEIVVVTGPDFEGDRGEYGLVLDSDHAKLFDPDSGVRVA